MHSLIILIALLGSVSAPEASTLPFPTSDLDQRAQDHNHSYGLITHGSSHGLMTHGLIPGSLPVDTLNQTTAQGSKDPQKVVLPDYFRLILNVYVYIYIQVARVPRLLQSRQ